MKEQGDDDTAGSDDEAVKDDSGQGKGGGRRER